MSLSIDRVVLVTKPTRLQELVAEYQTRGTAAFLLQSRGDSIEVYDREHARYEEALAMILGTLPIDLDAATVSRADLPHFLFRERDLVIVCGPDGLFVNLAQYIGNQPVVGVNPDPASVAGVLMSFSPVEVEALVRTLRQGTDVPIETLPFVRATIDGRQVVWGINDIFLGRRDQVSARYAIAFGDRRERHSSSGVIVSTALGARAWLRSIAAMTQGLIGPNAKHCLEEIPAPTTRELRFVVREPFPTPQTQAGLVTGKIGPGGLLRLTSEMPQGGVVFSDGNVDEAAEWPAGSVVGVAVADRMIQRVARPGDPGVWVRQAGRGEVLARKR